MCVLGSGRVGLAVRQRAGNRELFFTDTGNEYREDLDFFKIM